MIAEKEHAVGQQIGRYRITGELGRGGMGVVYRAEDHLIGREVAIKTLTEVTPELRERFYIEARSGILSHPNIVSVYELGEHEGIPFIAMELIEGESLEAMLQLRKRLPLLEALSIIEQLCAGLGYAHTRGVVHRDMKPANVLVQLDGRVTLVDFGIARLAEQMQGLTKTDTLMGTFHYIAPERLKGEESDGRADIWSVGIMLYEMLTGELPFRGKDVSSIYRVVHEPHVPIAQHAQDLPDGLSRALDRALAKEVDRRYATAEEMIFDLQVIAEKLKQDRVAALLAQDRVARALEILPGEAVLLRLKSEAELQKQKADQRELVRRVMLEAQELFAEHPKRALQVVEKGLERARASDTFLQSRAQLQERLRNRSGNAARANTIKAIHVALEVRNYEEAQRLLKIAIETYGEKEDLQELQARITADQAKLSKRPWSGTLLSRVAAVESNTQLHSIVRGVQRNPSPPNIEAAALLRDKGSAETRKRSKSKWYIASSVAVLTSVAGGAALLDVSRRDEPASPVALPHSVALTYLDVNASPWAEVIHIKDAAGKDIRISSEDRMTPLHLEGVAPGQYLVTLADASGSRHEVPCAVSVQQHLCDFALSDPDVPALLTGEQP